MADVYGTIEFERIAHVELELVGLSLQDLEDEEGSLRVLLLKMLDKKLSEAIESAKKTPGEMSAKQFALATTPPGHD